MASLALPLVLIASALAMVNWRNGLLVAVVVALAQDPLRKITPDQPVVYVVFVAIVFAAACLGAASAGVPLTPGSIKGWRRNLGAPFTLFMVVVVLQALHSLTAYGNLMLPLIGGLSYLAPFPALVFTYQLAIRGGVAKITGFYVFYLVCATLALMTVYIEFTGASWPILGEVGEGIIIYDMGGIMRAHAGTFRASEIAAWHAAAAACVFFLATVGRRPSLVNILLTLIYIAFALGVGALTGRRKMVMVIAIFVGSYFALTALFQKGAARTAISAGLAGFAAYALAGTLTGPDPVATEIMAGNYDSYVGRNQTVFNDALERFLEMGLSPILWAYERFGLFGAGLGAGSQGAQHFGGGAEAFGGAAEGGLGKIVLELGIPGLFIAAWFAIAFGRHIWRSMRAVSRSSQRLTPLACALLSFLMANVASFTVATQAFGDLFVLLMLGSTLGFLLALPVLAEQEARRGRAGAAARRVFAGGCAPSGPGSPELSTAGALSSAR